MARGVCRATPARVPRGARPGASDDRGQILILTAFMMVAMVGVAALVIDVAYAYDRRSRLSAAADAAAITAGLEVLRNSSVSDAALAVFANQQIVANGFDPASLSVTLRRGPASGPFQSNMGYVEVVLSEATPMFFGRVLGFSSLSPTARAVAGYQSGKGCLITLGTSGVGISASSNAEVTATNCDIAVNSSASNAINASSNADVTAENIDIVGNYRTSSNATVSPEPNTGATATNDPFASLLRPASTTPCTSFSLGPNATATIFPGTYCGLSVSANATLTLASGIYVLTGGGGLSVSSNGTLRGTGVMIYNAGTGAMSVSSNGSINLSAPTTGPYAGIVLAQDPSNTTAVSFSSNSRTFTGALYFPTAGVSFSSNSALSTDCSLVVAASVTVSSNASLGLRNTCSTFGGSPIRSVSMAE